MVEADRAGEDVLDPVAGEQVEVLLVDRAVTADQDGIHALGLVTVVVGQKGTDQLEVEVILVQLLEVWFLNWPHTITNNFHNTYFLLRLVENSGTV